MYLMKWNADYSVSIPELDVHHRHLFFLLNQLNESMSRGNGNEILGQTLEELVEYTKFHFQAEENLMLSMRFPGLTAHVREHDQMMARVSKFQQDFSSGKAVVSVHVLSFVRNWLQRHVLAADKQYSLFMSE